MKTMPVSADLLESKSVCLGFERPRVVRLQAAMVEGEWLRMSLCTAIVLSSPASRRQA
jgi:hypothetical protein